MRAHSHTIDQRSQVSVKVHVDGLDWFQRVCQWFMSFSHRSPQDQPLSLYGTWDPKHERFHQMKADAAADLVAARHGISWATKIYGACL